MILGVQKDLKALTFYLGYIPLLNTFHYPKKMQASAILSQTTIVGLATF
jgi:hypothetical protein